MGQLFCYTYQFLIHDDLIFANLRDDGFYCGRSHDKVVFWLGWRIRLAVGIPCLCATLSYEITWFYGISCVNAITVVVITVPTVIPLGLNG